MPRSSSPEGSALNLKFWEGKRVFLTGHTGFKGSWLSLLLQSMGAQVTGYALAPPTQPSLFESADVRRGMRSVTGDVRDLASLRDTMQKAEPEIVIHMAAQPLLRYSYSFPVETYATNVMGTVHLLESVRHTPSVRVVVNVTTDKCYDNREWDWGYRECDPIGGYDPYSSSKGCSELVTSGYRSSFFNPEQYNKHGVAVASARAGNVIGGGDWGQDRLITDVMNAFRSGKPVLIRKPAATRPWQHVLEPLRGYLMLAERLYQDGSAFAEAWNFGPYEKDALPVGAVVKMLAEEWGTDASLEIDQGNHPHEAQWLRLDSSKAGRRLQWYPALSLSEAIALTVDWFKRIDAMENVRALTLKQIDDYQKLTHQ